MLVHMEPDPHCLPHSIAHNKSLSHIISIEGHSKEIYGLILLCIVISSLLENVFFVLLTIRPLHRLCYLHRRRKKFAFLTRTRANITSLAYSLQSTVMTFPVRVVAPNSGLESCARHANNRLPIPHPIQPYRRKPCRSRCISAESNDVCRYHTVHRFTFYYFCSLCISITLLMCATLLNVLIEFQECKGNPFMVDTRHIIQCLLVEISITALVMVMSFTLVQLTTDRLIAICQPFHYWRIMSAWKCLLVIAVGWFTSIIFALIPHIHLGFNSEQLTSSLKYCFVVGMQGFKGFYTYAYVYITLVFLIPLSFILLAYAKIHRIVSRSADVHAENHARYLLHASGTETLCDSVLTLTGHHIRCRTCSGMCAEPPNSTTRGSASRRAASRHRLFNNLPFAGCSQEAGSSENVQCLNDYLKKARAAKSAVLIVSSFYGLMLPYMCVVSYQPVIVEYNKCKNFWLEGFETASILLVYAATIITPVIYAVRDGALRKRLGWFFRNFKLFCLKKGIHTTPFLSD